jgi:hypothetical protein
MWLLQLRESAPIGVLAALDDVPAERHSRVVEFRPFSALSELPAEPEWLWRGYLAPGSLTMLAGHPFAGKSMLVGGLLRAIEDGREFLGRPTSKSTALVITEEDEGALRQRADVLDLLTITSEYGARSTGSLNLEWPALIERTRERALERGHRLLVIDTFPGLAGLAGDEENDAGAVGERLRPLQQAAGTGLAVLFLHHMNRYGQPRGSKALSGVVDISIRFTRDSRTNRFRLTAESRFPTATPASWRGQLVRSKNPWEYQPLSTEQAQAVPDDVAGSASNRDRLLRAVESTGSTGITYDEIGALPGLSKDIAKRFLPRWRGTRVQAHGRGRKGDPLRWYALPPSGAVQNERKESKRTESY